MADKMMEGDDNMAGSIPKQGEPSHDYRMPVNPDAKGAVYGASVVRTNPSERTSKYE